LERPPPKAFFPFTSGFTGPWATINGIFVYCPTFGNPAPGFDTRSTWEHHFQPAGRDLFVFKYKDAGVWRLSVQYWNVIPFVGIAILDYEREFPNGFPKWPDFYQIDYKQDNGGWVWGKPAIVNLWIGNYSLMPTNFCSS
jgi:hypothetical protein